MCLNWNIVSLFLALFDFIAIYVSFSVRLIVISVNVGSFFQITFLFYAVFCYFYESNKTILYFSFPTETTNFQNNVYIR